MARVARPREARPEPDPGTGGNGRPIEEAKPSFFERLAGLSEEDWQTHKLYIYRRWPRISRSDQAHYIEQVRHAVDEGWLLQNHGSGKYSLRLNDKKRTLDSYVVEVHDLDRPPKVKPEELVDCEENARYFELWPEAKPKGKPEDATGSDVVATAFREIGKIAREKAAVDSTLADLYLQTAAARDALVERLAATKKPDAEVAEGISALDKILGLVERLQKPAQGTAQAQPDPLTMLDKVSEILERLRPQPAPVPAPSGLAQVKELLSVGKDLREFFNAGGEAEPEGEGLPRGRGRGGKTATWLTVLQSAGGLLPYAAPTIAALSTAIPTLLRGTVDALKGNPAAPQPGVGGPGPAVDGVPLASGTAPNPNPAGGIPLIPGASSAPPPPPGGPPPASAPAGIPGLNPELQRILELVTQLGPLLLGAVMRGQTGGEFADGLALVYGPLMLDEITSAGREGILAALQMNPGVWQALAAHQRKLEEFIDEFLAPPEEELEEKTAEPTTGKPKKRAQKAAAADTAAPTGT